MSEQQSNVVQFEKTRTKSLIGGVLMEVARRNPAMHATIRVILDQHITHPEDRAVLEAEGWL